MARPYREISTLERATTLGMYFRLLVPERSRLESVSAGTTQPLTAAADVADELGRTVIANYFRIPPGVAHLPYRWISPYPADLGEYGVFTYRATRPESTEGHPAARCPAHRGEPRPGARRPFAGRGDHVRSGRGDRHPLSSAGRDLVDAQPRTLYSGETLAGRALHDDLEDDR